MCARWLTTPAAARESLSDDDVDATVAASGGAEYLNDIAHAKLQSLAPNPAKVRQRIRESDALFKRLEVATLDRPSGPSI
ncbi:MAG: hypothetical protein MHM6MM_009258 [Cercozoa sp. M6MM]